MTDDSEAEAAYHALEPLSREPHSHYLRRRLVAIGALGKGETARPRYPAMFDQPLRKGLSDVRDEVVDALVDLGRSHAELSTVTVGLTADDESLARYERKNDETGLVLISDSLVALCSAFCEYEGRALGRVMVGGWIRTLGRILKTRWVPLGEDYRLLAGILRYHNVTRRAYGIPAVLNFTPRSVDEQGRNLDFVLQELMLDFGLRFSIGHEVAHHVLGHGTPADPPFEQRELDADTLALFVAAEAFNRQTVDMDHLAQRWRHEAAEFHGLIGALITMLALDTTERALFVRRGRTHPSASARLDRLVAEFLSPQREERLERILGRRDPRVTMRFEKDRGSLVTYLRNAALATTAATSFDDGARAFDWTAFAASRSVEQPRAGHLNRIAELDRLMCSPEATLGHEAAAGLDPEGVRLVLAGDTAGALLKWDVAPATVRQIHDESRSLAFQTLVEAIGAPLPAGADRVRLGVAAATLVGRKIAAPDVRRAGETASQSTP
ncbi:MAG: hypothetical protein ACRDRK_00200 [Pseudonocardia sp.]